LSGVDLTKIKTMKDILDLRVILKEQWSNIIETFNSHLSEKFSELFFMSYKYYTEKMQTQERTKILSPIFNGILLKIMGPFGLIKNELNGCDLSFKSTILENKITLSLSNKWTGNGYAKTSWHLLIKLDVDDYGKVISSFACLVPLENCVSKWTEPNTDSNFSSLVFNNEDYEKILIIQGDLVRKSKQIHQVLL